MRKLTTHVMPLNLVYVSDGIIVLFGTTGFLFGTSDVQITQLPQSRAQEQRGGDM